MRRLALIALFLMAPLAMAKESAPPQLPPCMPVSEMRMTHVIRVPTWPSIFSIRKDFRMRRAAKTIIEKLPVVAPASTIRKVAVVKKKALRKRAGKVKGCKPGRTKNKRGKCGRWK